ncbi:MAG TPA: gluconate 2-dehydrogenase subunit 3 family protein, partial [Longimicrobiales bacterium]|nr:gluconate 2-dehydrogenase subunit 3 family protein [Longimicrobiales bacterium]
MDRRTALRIMSVTPFIGVLEWTTADMARAATHVDALAASHADTPGAAPFEPQFFSEHEWRTVRILVDLIIPADAKSGSATDALVPEFMDFIMQDMPERQLPMRGGLACLDAECGRRFVGRDFLDCGDTERRAVLDDIAWPKTARPEHSHGTAWFTSFRDLTASGF